MPPQNESESQKLMEMHDNGPYCVHINANGIVELRLQEVPNAVYLRLDPAENPQWNASSHTAWVTAVLHRAAVCMNFLRGIPTETLETTKAQSTIVQLFLKWMETRDDTDMAMCIDEMQACFSNPTEYVTRDKLLAEIKRHNPVKAEELTRTNK